MLISQVPRHDSPHVLDFCSSIVKGQPPIVVPHEPLDGEPIGESFDTVPKHIVAHKGKQLNGWAIWQVADLYIEAEFHAVWQDTDGALIDLTPHWTTHESILFLPESGREYGRRNIDGVRRALTDDLDVIRFLHLAKKRFDIMNEGDLAYQFGDIELPARSLREVRKVYKEMMQLQHRLTVRYT